MKRLKQLLIFLIVAIFGLGLLYVFINFYPYIFSKRVTGEFLSIARVDIPMTIVTRPNAEMNPQVFSYAIAIRDPKSNEIFTASSQDRQWAVVQQGQCGEVKLFPYPPWKLERDGTYHNARLEKLFDCPLPEIIDRTTN